jgi:hypothetical protein
LMKLKEIFQKRGECIGLFLHLFIYDVSSCFNESTYSLLF